MTRRDKYAKNACKQTNNSGSCCCCFGCCCSCFFFFYIWWHCPCVIPSLCEGWFTIVRCFSVFFAGCLAVSLAYSIYTFPLLIPLPLAVPLPLSPVTILNPVCPACVACCHSQKSWASIFWADNNNNYGNSSRGSRDGQQAELRRQRARSSSAAAHTHVQTHT